MISSDCTLATCPIDRAYVHYQHSIPANSFFIELFILLLLLQLILGLWYRTWSFPIATSCGLVLELIGYAGRLLLQQTPFNFSTFLMYVSILLLIRNEIQATDTSKKKKERKKRYLIPRTIRPAFFSGGIYPLPCEDCKDIWRGHIHGSRIRTGCIQLSLYLVIFYL